MDYAYPPLSETDECELPDLWRHLPSLCLPDGAHNHEADTVFFHLPHLTKPDQTVFGVSCYRQIDAEVREHKENYCYPSFLLFQYTLLIIKNNWFLMIYNFSLDSGIINEFSQCFVHLL